MRHWSLVERPTMQTIGVSLLGMGNVGTGVAKILVEHHDRIARRVGLNLRLRKVVVRDPDKPRAVPASQITTDLNDVLNDDETSIAVELWGGVDAAHRALSDLLDSGKNVVTANKALLAERGLDLFERAHRLERSVAFEAAVAGGIPIIAAVGQSLVANQIISISGILNGTSNYILTAMAEKGESYAQALAQAQELGYAEADPTMDVDGTDAAQKLAILSQLGFGCRASSPEISRQGIDSLDLADVHYAGELGYVVKLLATAKLENGQVAMRVSPCLVRAHAPLAEVRGAYNAVKVVGDAVGDTLFYGQGAGQMPTASAVVADIVDTALGRAAHTFQTLRLWTDSEQAPVVMPPENVRDRYYLRFQVEDRPGVLAKIAQSLGESAISISSVIQHEAPENHEGEDVPLVIMTHTAAYGGLLSALERIAAIETVHQPSVCLPVVG